MYYLYRMRWNGTCWVPSSYLYKALYLTAICRVINQQKITQKYDRFYVTERPLFPSELSKGD